VWANASEGEEGVDSMPGRVHVEARECSSKAGFVAMPVQLRFATATSENACPAQHSQRLLRGIDVERAQHTDLSTRPSEASALEPQSGRPDAQRDIHRARRRHVHSSGR
jgi:hypothetical protein